MRYEQMYINLELKKFERNIKEAIIKNITTMHVKNDKSYSYVELPAGRFKRCRDLLQLDFSIFILFELVEVDRSI